MSAVNLYAVNTAFLQPLVVINEYNWQNVARFIVFALIAEKRARLACAENQRAYKLAAARFREIAHSRRGFAVQLCRRTARNLQNSHNQAHYNNVIGTEILKHCTYDEERHRKYKARHNHAQHFADTRMAQHACVVAEDDV